MEINKISVVRMNNGAHFLYNTDFYARIDAETAVKKRSRKHWLVINRQSTSKMKP